MFGNSKRIATSCVWLAVGAWFAVDATISQSVEVPAEEMARRIDTAIAARLTAAKTPVSPAADDAEFIRRAYLDLHGVVPRADHVVEFLNNTAANKRTQLI